MSQVQTSDTLILEITSSGKVGLGALFRTMFTAGWYNLKMMAIDWFVIFTVIIQPLLFAFLAIFLLKGKGAEFPLISIVVGSGMVGIWGGLLFSSAFNLEGERWIGSLEYIVASPTPLGPVITAKTASNVLTSFVSMSACYALAAVLLRVPITIANIPAFLLAVLVALASLLCFGMLLAPLFAVNLMMTSWANALEFPVYILGGFLFPISLLPGWTNPLSYILAPYWACRAMCAAATGGEGMWAEISLSIAVMAILSAVYVILSFWLFRVVLHRLRERALLGMQ